ncbi:molybdopterin dinucleotide binding domain-containing protein [Candidatus Hecatella orcuttiae]|uniref:molybdopterin dinucleotide binding domain-containing protein n=1 Tax=Candidatus Hecatella orcuttiae TaxID=1935119 RepID=UPI002867FA61|nr:molybdopterin dinucleotide binding domain-containing protein [Candidatus Hecatella orcuttiae]
MKAVLITGTSIAQAQGKEHGKLSAKYKDSVAVCEMDESDMAALKIEPGQTVKVTSPYGSITVKAAKSREPRPGLVFIPVGPWANRLVGPETGGTGTPSYKGLEVEVEPAPGEKVPDLEELMAEARGGNEKW